jgi:hypothetical protein
MKAFKLKEEILANSPLRNRANLVINKGFFSTEEI